MNLKEFIAEHKEFDERTFGKFVRQRREELGKTVRGFAAELGITPAYLSDIEKGNRAAPKKFFQQIRIALGVPEDMMTEFEDLASASRGFQYEDITPYLGKRPLARVALRKARDMDISDEQWEEIIKAIDSSNDKP